jgi:hypothetical protein
MSKIASNGETRYPNLTVSTSVLPHALHSKRRSS